MNNDGILFRRTRKMRPGEESELRGGVITITGADLWAGLHRLALNPDKAEAFTRFLAGLRNAIPCGVCRGHWDAWIANNPPDGDLFAWTVAAHNAVNARLGRPLFHVEEARARWAPPAVDTGPK